MVRIIFVCHGNICRSPMAESIFAFRAEREGILSEVVVSSAATHADELGNPPHGGTRRKLAQMKVPLIPHRARLLERSDGEKFDYFIGMDAENRRDMERILGANSAHKIRLLLDFTDHPRDVADPWYTGDFDETYEDIVRGVDGLFAFLRKKGKL